MNVEPLRARWWMVWACVLLAAPALAEDHFVNDDSVEGDVAFPGCPVSSPGRDLVGCGSCEFPCRTPDFLFQQAARFIQIKDTVWLNTGRYHPPAPQEPVVSIDIALRIRPEGEWLTLSGPVDAEGRALRDAEGIPLAVLDGKGEAQAGVVIEGSWVRLRALRLEGFASGNIPGNGSAVIVLDSYVAGYDFDQLDIADVGPRGSAIHVQHGRNVCQDCSIRRNRIHASRSGFPAIWIDSQDGVRIVGNHIIGWGEGSNASGIRFIGDKIGILHNVIQNSAGPAIEGEGTVRVSHNTFRTNARVPVSIPDGPSGVELLLSGPHRALIDHNIFAPRPDRTALAIQTLEPGHAIDFNGYELDRAYVAFTEGGRYDALSEWQLASGLEKQSLVGEARFASETDAHLQSESGRWDGAGWVPDALTSDFIDAGDPFAMGAEAPFLHGHVPNLGAYGNTEEASLSIATLVKRGGDGQEGQVGQPLPEPLRLEVRGFNRLGDLHPSHPDVPVRFRVKAGEAELTEEAVVTDGGGRAQVGVTPQMAGTLRIEAFVEGVPGVEPVTFEVTASEASDGADPDPGAEPEPGPGRAHYTVSPGCAQAVGPQLPLAMLALAGLLRRRRRCP